MDGRIDWPQPFRDARYPWLVSRGMMNKPLIRGGCVSYLCDARATRRVCWNKESGGICNLHAPIFEAIIQNHPDWAAHIHPPERF